MTASTTSTTTTATEVYTALIASVIPEFLEVTWTNPSAGVVKGTAVTAGKPFTVTATTTETGGGGADSQTFVRSASVTNSGPNVVSLAGNWEGGVAPIDADDVVFDSGTSDVLYDLDQNGITPASITVGPGYKGKIGLPVVNTDDTQYPYFEYRETYLKYGNSGDSQTVTVTIAGGLGRIKLSQGTAQAVWNINNSDSPLESGIPSVLLKGTHASNVLNLSKGNVGVAFFGGETSTLVGWTSGYQTNPAGDSTLVLGAGVTQTSAVAVVTGGTVEINSAMTSSCSLTIYDGVVTYRGTGGIAAGLAVRGGQCIYNTTGTLGGAPVVSGSGVLDFSQDLRTKTVTNAIDCYGDKASILDPNKVVGTLVIDLDETKNADRINIGTNIRLTRGAVA